MTTAQIIVVGLAIIAFGPGLAFLVIGPRLHEWLLERADRRKAIHGAAGVMIALIEMQAAVEKARVQNERLKASLQKEQP